jgi:hypothetical protein
MSQLPDRAAGPVTAGGQRETRTVAGLWAVAVTLGLFLAAAARAQALYLITRQSSDSTQFPAREERERP